MEQRIKQAFKKRSRKKTKNAAGYKIESVFDWTSVDESSQEQHLLFFFIFFLE